jgi:hypothetical protein
MRGTSFDAAGSARPLTCRHVPMQPRRHVIYDVTVPLFNMQHL